jgi:pyridoxal phosphate enzyme (YggS family)
MELSSEQIAQNWLRLQDEVNQLEQRYGRQPGSVSIIAVSKFHTVQSIMAAYQAGAREFGENYAQELRDKVPQFPEEAAHWHFIGSLQSNKVKYIVPGIFMLHTLSSISVAGELQKLAVKQQCKVKTLLQINTSGQASKSGMQPAQAMDFACTMDAEYSAIELAGLMTIPTDTEDISVLSKEFAGLHKLRDEIAPNLRNPNLFKELSMGMSGDYPLAIAEGATMIRIGTAIFGARV